jgi:hypothetical protein
MLALAKAVTSGWWQGPLLAALFFQLPILQWLSMAILALITLRGGLHPAALGILAVFGGTLLTIQTQAVLPLAGLLAALVVILAAQVLRTTRRIEWAWATAAITTVLGFGLLLFGKPAVLNQYQAVVDQVMTVWLNNMPQSEAEVFKAKTSTEQGVVGALLVQLLSISTMISAGIGLTLGRYWQAELFNPGGFGAEMRGFRLEPTLALLLLGLWLVGQSGTLLWSGLMQVLWLPFLVGGIGCFHWFAFMRKLPVFSYVAFYMAVLLVQVVVVLFAVIDSFFDVRKRLAGGFQK